MQLTARQKETIEKTLSDYLTGPPDIVEGSDLRMIAAELYVLPMMCDIGGCFGICMNGDIASFNWHKPYELTVESDPRFIRLVLMRGSLKHPELAMLVPEKPIDAVPCLQCDGSGCLNKATVCVCGGLGWLLPTD